MEAVNIENKNPIVSRIGRKTNKKRPIKVKFVKEIEKLNVMKNLKNLKGLKDFEGISVKDDYTWLERATIKEFVDIAKKRNEAEPPDSDTVWKVRGNLKSGLQIKKLTKLVQKPKQKHFVVIQNNLVNRLAFRFRPANV